MYINIKGDACKNHMIVKFILLLSSLVLCDINQTYELAKSYIHLVLRQ